MNLLSKVAYYKIQFLATIVETRSVLNVLGLCSDKQAEKKNKKDVFKVLELVENLNEEDARKMMK